MLGALSSVGTGICSVDVREVGVTADIDLEEEGGDLMDPSPGGIMEKSHLFLLGPKNPGSWCRGRGDGDEDSVRKEQVKGKMCGFQCICSE